MPETLRLRPLALEAVRLLGLAGLLTLAGARMALGAPIDPPADLQEHLSDTERVLRVAPERIEQVRQEVAEALRVALGERIESVELALARPRLLLSNGDLEVVFDHGEIDIDGLDVSGIKVRGRIRVEDLRLDYAALGLRRFRLTGAPRVFPDLETSLENVDAYLASHGFRDTFVREREGGAGIEFGGRRPVRILFARTNPLVTISGRFTLNGTVLGFDIDELQVRDTSGPVASAIQRRIRSEGNRKIDLAELFQGFEVRGIEVRDGMLRVMSGARALLAQRLEGSAITAAAG
jgi:hypothetical protein